MSLWTDYFNRRWCHGHLEEMKEEKKVVEKVTCISKRCLKCGLQPSPTEMVKMWGEDWLDQTMCTHCRHATGGGQVRTLKEIARITGVTPEQRGEMQHPRINISQRRPGAPTYGRKVYVSIHPKLEGLPDELIKEWYVDAEERSRLRKWYTRSEVEMVYVSDGDRFWKWTDFTAGRPLSSIDLPALEEKHPYWEPLPEGEPKEDYFRSYIHC